MLLGPLVLLLRASGIATNLQFLHAQKKEAGGRVTTDTTRPTKRVSVGAETVEDAPLCTCVKRNDSTGSPCRCWFVSMLVLRMISPKTGFLARREFNLVISN